MDLLQHLIDVDGVGLLPFLALPPFRLTGLGRDAGVWMDLLQHLIDVDGVGLLPLLALPSFGLTGLGLLLRIGGSGSRARLFDGLPSLRWHRGKLPSLSLVEVNQASISL